MAESQGESGLDGKIISLLVSNCDDQSSPAVEKHRCMTGGSSGHKDIVRNHVDKVVT